MQIKQQSADHYIPVEYDRLDIDNARCIQLDWIGAKAGFKRTGWNDALCLLLLKAKTGKKNHPRDHRGCDRILASGGPLTSNV